MRNRQQIAELFWAAFARISGDLAPAEAEFAAEHAPHAQWRDAMNNWLGGPIGEYAALVSDPAIGRALEKLLVQWAQAVPLEPDDPDGLAVRWRTEIELAEAITFGIDMRTTRA